MRSWALLDGLDAGGEMGGRWDGKKGVLIHFFHLVHEPGPCGPQGVKSPLLSSPAVNTRAQLQPHAPSPLLRRSAACVLLRLLTPAIVITPDRQLLSSEMGGKPSWNRGWDGAAGTLTSRDAHRQPTWARVRRDSVVSVAECSVNLDGIYRGIYKVTTNI